MVENEKLRKRVERYAAVNGLRIEEENYANVVAAGGNCPCRVGAGVPCPCKFAKSEIAKNGHCLCKLFWKK